MWILRGCELSFYTRLGLSAPDCCVNDCHDAGQETSEDNHDEEERDSCDVCQEGCRDKVTQ